MESELKIKADAESDKSLQNSTESEKLLQNSIESTKSSVSEKIESTEISSESDTTMKITRSQKKKKNATKKENPKKLKENLRRVKEKTKDDETSQKKVLEIRSDPEISVILEEEKRDQNRSTDIESTSQSDKIEKVNRHKQDDKIGTTSNYEVPENLSQNYKQILSFQKPTKQLITLSDTKKLVENIQKVVEKEIVPQWKNDGKIISIKLDNMDVEKLHSSLWEDIGLVKLEIFYRKQVWDIPFGILEEEIKDCLQNVGVADARRVTYIKDETRYPTKIITLIFNRLPPSVIEIPFIGERKVLSMVPKGQIRCSRCLMLGHHRKMCLSMKNNQNLFLNQNSQVKVSKEGNNPFDFNYAQDRNPKWLSLDGAEASNYAAVLKRQENAKKEMQKKMVILKGPPQKKVISSNKEVTNSIFHFGQQLQINQLPITETNKNGINSSTPFTANKTSNDIQNSIGTPKSVDENSSIISINPPIREPEVTPKSSENNEKVEKAAKDLRQSIKFFRGEANTRLNHFHHIMSDLTKNHPVENVDVKLKYSTLVDMITGTMQAISSITTFFEAMACSLFQIPGHLH